MARTEIYRLDAFVFETDDTEGLTLIVTNIARTWEMRIGSGNTLHYLWLSCISEAKGSLTMRKALDATITLLFSLSHIGIHDAQLTNDLTEALTAAQERITRVLNGIEAQRTREEAAEEARDNADYMERAVTLDGNSNGNA